MADNYNIDLIADIEDLIKRYNKNPEKRITKKDIVVLLQKAEVLVPGRLGIKRADMKDETLVNLDLRPDIVKDGGKTRLLPVFTTFSQIPEDYLDTFSFIRVNCGEIYAYIEGCSNVAGIVVNPFTELNLEVKKKKGARKTATKQVSTAVADDAKEAVIIYNDEKYPIKKTPFTIGRENANIEIGQSYISKVHVVISFKDGKYRIADYDSTNGTKVNGTALRPKVYYELKDGYEIQLADKETMLVDID